MENATLNSIKKRRSITNFLVKQVSKADIQTILEAGRWAPSRFNAQPWKFIIIRDESVKSFASEIIPTVFKAAIKTAPIFIAVCVNPEISPNHYIEEGAIATQNMALAAYSINLGSSWIGIFSLSNEKNSTERKLKELLKIPKEWRLISILPIGYPKFIGKKSRKELDEIVNWDNFQSIEKEIQIEKGMYNSKIKKIQTPSSTPPI
jgi:nitroreductase